MLLGYLAIFSIILILILSFDPLSTFKTTLKYEFQEANNCIFKYTDSTGKY